MKQPPRSVLLTAACLMAACQDGSNPVQPSSSHSQDLTPDAANQHVVPGQYIVVFKRGVANSHALAQTLLAAHGGSLRQAYASALKGFAARLPDAAVGALRQNPLVAYVEPDQVVHADATEQMDANGDPWGLDRIDQRALPLDRSYTYMSTGAGVHVYLIDTGIWTLHPEFEGRADIVYDVAGLNGLDCNGHGTAVAGVVGSATYGVAKRVFLHGLRVYLECGTVGLLSNVLAGMDWVAANHASPAVVNLSVSLDPSPALTEAVHNLWNSGVFVVATAANHNSDACLEAGGASGAFTVAASTVNDTKAEFSNWGSCISVYAPGVNIKSTWLAGLTMLTSGTSVAAPHVTGVAALYKAILGDAPSDDIANWIRTNATGGVIAGNTPGTPNLLVFTVLPGDLTVTTSTIGSSLPPSGYTYTAAVDGGPGQAILPNGSVTFAALLPTHHTVALSGVTPNCALSGANPQTVTVPSGGATTITFAVTCPPVADFMFSCSGLTCTFDASGSTALPSAAYSWSWGDGATGTGQTATYAYAAAGMYSVTLTVTDAGGSSTKTQTVTVSAPPAI